jgi:hypothetical protein
METKKIPLRCPSCNSMLLVKSMVCNACSTVVSGEFGLPILTNLENADQDFILDFVKSSGSLKLMAEKLKMSYPTVRNKLDDIITKIENIEKNLVK